MGLADFSNGGKANGKGVNDKGGKAADASKGDTCFVCLWDDSWAATKPAQTFAGRSTCHGCGRHKAQALQPPLERMVAWTFVAKITREPQPSKVTRGQKAKERAARPKRVAKAKQRNHRRTPTQ